MVYNQLSVVISFLVDNNFENGYLLLIAKNELGFKNLSRLVSNFLFRQ